MVNNFPTLNVPVALLQNLRNKDVANPQLDAAQTYPPPPRQLIPNPGVRTGNTKNILSPIRSPHAHDVLSGRGKSINHHPGNKYFISLIKPLKTEYVATPKQEKSMFARMVIQKIKNLNPPGRFLKQNPNTGAWYEIGDKKAILKTRQALREGAPEIEKLLKNGAVVAKMKDSLDALSVKRALDKIVKPADCKSLPSKRQKAADITSTNHRSSAEVNPNTKNHPMPNNDAQLLINFAADSSSAAAAAASSKPPAARSDSRQSDCREKQKTGVSDHTPMPPLSQKGGDSKRGKMAKPLSCDNEISYRSENTSGDGKNKATSAQDDDDKLIKIQQNDLESRKDQSGIRRVSCKSQQDIAAAVDLARRSSGFASQGVAILPVLGAEDSQNRRVSYKANQELDAIQRSSNGPHDIVVVPQDKEQVITNGSSNHLLNHNYQGDIGMAMEMARRSSITSQGMAMIPMPQGISYIPQPDVSTSRQPGFLSYNNHNLLACDQQPVGATIAPLIQLSHPDIEMAQRSASAAQAMQAIILQNQIVVADGNGRLGPTMQHQLKQGQIPMDGCQNRRVGIQAQQELGMFHQPTCHVAIPHPQYIQSSYLLPDPNRRVSISAQQQLNMNSQAHGVLNLNANNGHIQLQHAPGTVYQNQFM